MSVNRWHIVQGIASAASLFVPLPPLRFLGAIGPVLFVTYQNLQHPDDIVAKAKDMAEFFLGFLTAVLFFSLALLII